MTTNIIKQTDLAKAQSIDFANRFGDNINNLVTALGVTRTIPMVAGMVINTYKSVTDVQSGAVGEGELIPLSKIEKKVAKTHLIELSKYRKQVTGEAIQRSGFDNAVAETDDLLLREIQKDIRAKLFGFMATGTGTASGVGLQGALAQAWGTVQTLFDDDAVETVAFINPMDVANYNGQAQLTIQKEFGMTFVGGFTDVKVITNASVPVGKIYATAPENIVLAYIPVNGSELGNVFGLTSDESGYVGINHSNKNDNVTVETLALSGLVLFAERLDGVVVVDIEEAIA